MSSSTDVVGYAYEADLHCESCAEKRFGAEALSKHYEEPGHAEDGEGNPVTPVFNGEDAYEDCSKCDGRGECTCDDCGNRHDCDACEGNMTVSRRCGDCGEPLVD